MSLWTDGSAKIWFLCANSIYFTTQSTQYKPSARRTAVYRTFGKKWHLAQNWNTLVSLCADISRAWTRSHKRQTRFVYQAGRQPPIIFPTGSQKKYCNLNANSNRSRPKNCHDSIPIHAWPPLSVRYRQYKKGLIGLARASGHIHGQLIIQNTHRAK